MKVVFNIFGINIYFLGLMTGIGILAGLAIAYLEVRRKELDAAKFFDIALYSILAAILGARIFYILFYNFNYYLKNPTEIIMFNEGGLSIQGALLGALIFAFFYFRKHKLNFFKYADAIAPAIILGQGIGRVGCDVFGKVMSSPLPWGIERQGQLLHPVQVYEFLLNYLVFYILWRKRKRVNYDGQLFVWYIILFSINRGIVEFFRTNPTFFGLFSVSHLLSIIFIAGAIGLMIYAKHSKAFYPIEQAVDVTSYKYERLIEIGSVVLLAAVSLVIFYALQG